MLSSSFTATGGRPACNNDCLVKHGLFFFEVKDKVKHELRNENSRRALY